MEKEKIERINALAKKKKEEGLTDLEAAEQAELRQAYIREMRESVKATLERVYLEQEDGSYQKLRRKPGQGKGPGR